MTHLFETRTFFTLTPEAKSALRDVKYMAEIAQYQLDEIKEKTSGDNSNDEIYDSLYFVLANLQSNIEDLYRYVRSQFDE